MKEWPLIIAFLLTTFGSCGEKAPVVPPEPVPVTETPGAVVNPVVFTPPLVEKQEMDEIPEPPKAIPVSVEKQPKVGYDRDVGPIRRFIRNQRGRVFRR